MNKFFKKIIKSHKKVTDKMAKVDMNVLLTILYFLVFPILKVIFLTLSFRKFVGQSTWETKESLYKDYHEHQF